MNKMKLKSKAIVNGCLKPEYGTNTVDLSQVKYGIPQRSFPLEWDDVPEGTESFALVFIDYDNVEDEGVPWIHWLLSDLDKEKRYLDDGEAFSQELIQGRNSWDLPYGPYEEIPEEYITRYGGPAPGRTHEYEIEFFALDIKPELKTGFYYNKIRRIIEKHQIEKTVLRFRYEV